MLPPPVNCSDASPNIRIEPVTDEGADPPKVALAWTGGGPKDAVGLRTSKIPPLLKEAAVTEATARLGSACTTKSPLLVRAPPSVNAPPINWTVPLLAKSTPASVVTEAPRTSDKKPALLESWVNA